MIMQPRGEKEMALEYWQLKTLTLRNMAEWSSCEGWQTTMFK